MGKGKDIEKRIRKEFSEIIKIQNILEKEKSLAGQAKAIYNAGFRDVSELREIVEKVRGEFGQGGKFACRKILAKLEQL